MDAATHSRAGTLTTRRVVFLVIAAAAPLTAIVGNVPLALVYGNGAGLPVAFALACVVLLCFSVGYAAMSRRVVNTGAFYTYVGCGLGRPPAIGAGYLAVVSYTALTTGLAGAVGQGGGRSHERRVGRRGAHGRWHPAPQRLRRAALGVAESGPGARRFAGHRPDVRLHQLRRVRVRCPLR